MSPALLREAEGILPRAVRVHFAGAYADNLPWGMDAATRSANRVAEAVDAA